MNFFVEIYLIIFILVFFSCVISAEEYKIFDSQTGKSMSLQDLANELVNFDVIFFGEAHDDSIIHKLQADILPLLYVHTKNLAISMEMFERDTQTVVDSFLEGKIAEKDFLKNSRAWPNYLTDYKPLIEFAKEKGLAVLAANVPRKYAAMIAKKDIISIYNLDEKERQFMAKELKVLEGDYKQRFIDSMKSHTMGDSTGMKRKMDYESYYAAQCLKDDTMAESMAEFLSKNPKIKVIHFNGYFHSNAHLGTAEKLSLLNPKLKIAVIAPVFVDENTKLDFPEEERGEGDFLIVKRY